MPPNSQSFPVASVHDTARLLADEFRPDGSTSIYFQNANGAVTDVPHTATAFSHRNAIANMMLLGYWNERSQDEAGRTAIRATWSRLAPFTDGYYVNLNDTDPKGTHSNYGPNFTRLATLKKQFDPLNLFRLNANIRTLIRLDYFERSARAHRVNLAVKLAGQRPLSTARAT